jgi:integrase
MHHMMKKASTIWSADAGIDRNPADHVEVKRPDEIRLIVLVALTTGMRVSEIFALKWSDVQMREGLIAVRAKLKGGKSATFR